MSFLRSLLAGRVAFLLPALFVLACSDDDPKPKDLCADVTCDQEGYACNPENGMCECTDNNCEVDLCADVTCDRGVCDVETGECANASVCSIETQDTDCVDGFACYGQRCVNEATFCADLLCDRGVCSFEARACVDATNCTSDMECLAGNFCADDGSCQLNACDAGMVDCPRGVCDEGTGVCVNADTCTSQDDCLDGNYCAAGACLPAAEACAACTGNQTCNYDGNTTVTCSESAAGCSTSLDCLDDRICRNGDCQAPTACVADALEPNNDAGTATNWFTTTKVLGAIPATLCAGDEDFFSYDLAQDPDFTGTLLVRATLHPEDVGLGELTVEVLNANGTAVANGTSVRGILQLTYTVGVLNQGIYTIRVGGQNLGTPGVRYNLIVDLLDAGLVAACQNAPALQATQTGNTVSGASIPLKPSCSVDASAPEDIYLLELTEARAVTLNLTSDANADLTLSLRSACEIDQSETTCINRTTAGGEERFEGVLLPGTYYVLVQAANAGANGTYTLTYTGDIPICTPVDNTCLDENTAVVCNTLGTALVNTPCANGCDSTTGTCSATGDSCGDFISVPTTGGTYSFSSVDLTNTISLPFSSCAGTSTPGPEAVLEVRGIPGQVATIVMTPTTGNAILYALSECGVTSSCSAGVNANTTSGGTETLQYIVQSTDPVYVVADFASSTGNGDFTVTVSFATPSCTPNEVSGCMNGVIEYCSPFGTEMSYGCSSGTCDGDLCGTPNGDVCFEAVDVGTGGVFTGTITTFNNDYFLGTGTSSACTSRSTQGRDAVYRVTGNEGDRVTVSLNSTFDAVLYAMTDCTASNVRNSCLDDSDSGNPETIQFFLPAGGEAFVVADVWTSTNNGGTGTYTLTVDVAVNTGCTDGEFLGCNAAGTALEYCNGGFVETRTCSSGSCAADACVDPNGDRCHEAIVVPVGGGSFSQTTTTGLTSAISLPFSSCAGTSTPGIDVIYQVQGNAGEVVTVTMTPTTTTGNAILYALSNCGDTSSCIEGINANAVAGSPETLQFLLPSSDPVFVVADYASSTASSAFNITFAIAPTSCAPNTSLGCVDGQINYCGRFGTPTSLACSSGICAADGLSCANPNGNSCQEPQLITTSTTLTGIPVAGLTNTISLATPSCTNYASPGPEKIYMVQGAPGDILEVTMTPSTSDASLYLLTECGVGSSCVDGSDGFGAENVSYQFPTDGSVTTVFIVADFFSPTPTGTFDLAVTFGTPDCDPIADIPYCVGADRVTCEGLGFTQTQTCPFGCDAASGACSTPTNDTCAGALVLQNGVPFTGNIADYTNDYSLGAGTSTTCSTRSTQGRDAVFRVTGAPGDRARITANVGFDAVLYAMTDCTTANVRDSCLDDSDIGNPERIEFLLPASGEAYVVVDVWSSTVNAGSGVFTITAEIDQATTCTPGEALGCDNNGGLQFCDSTGGFIQTYACSSGSCAGTTCDVPNGNACLEPVAVPLGGGTFQQSIASLTNTISVTSTSCGGLSNTTPGQEAIYAVQGNIGDVVTVNMDVSTGNGALYVLTTCGTVTSCTTGINAATTDADELLQFILTSTDPVYVVADFTTTTGNGNFEVEINIAPPSCVAGESFGCVDGEIGYCSNFGSPLTYDCSSGLCDGLGCDSPTGDNCREPELITTSTTLTAVPVAGLTNTINLASTTAAPSCTGDTSAGPEKIYAVQGSPGDILEVTMTPSIGDASLYFLTSCGVGTSCVAGSDTAFGGGAENASYQFPTDGSVTTVYIVADFYSSTSGTFDLDIAFGTPDCDPLVDIPYCSGADLITCSSVGLSQTTTCAFGCTVDQCNMPTNDTCSGALDITNAPFTGLIQDYTNQYQVSGCATTATQGRDAVFSVTGNPGDLVFVEVITNFDAVLYAAADCASIGPTCLDSADDEITFPGDEFINFVMPASGTAFIFVDVFSTNTAGTSGTGPFTVEATITAP